MKLSIKVAAITAFIIAFVSVTLIYWAVATPPALESITIGHVPVESFALLYVAQDQGYFTQHGLDVTITDYPTGTDAVNALTADQVDIAGSSEY